MGNPEASLRVEYARYFFSLFDACLHQDEVGRRLAQQSLEDVLDCKRGTAGLPTTFASPPV